MRCNAQTKVKISGTTAGRRLASTLKATLTRNPVFARRGKMAVRGNQLLSTNPTKCRLATPNRCGQAFAVEFCGSMPARYIRIVTDRVQAHRISIAPRTAKHRCIEIARTA